MKRASFAFWMRLQEHSRGSSLPISEPPRGWRATTMLLLSGPHTSWRDILVMK